MEELKVLELFGGIGAIRKAFERQNIPHKVVDYVEIDEFAVKSYNAMYGTEFEPQDISKWDKDIDVDFIMHGSPCLTSDNLILTNKGYIPLCDVQIGDLVLTKSRTWHKVNKIFDNGIKDTIYLKGMNFANIHCTPEHKFYVRQAKRIGHFGKRIFLEPEFLPANKLIKNKHYLGVPVIQEEIPFFTDDKEFWYMLGFYIGDGWIKKGIGNDICLSITDTKLDKILKHTTQEKWNWTFVEKYTNNKCYKLRFANKKMYEFIKKWIGTGCNEKHIPYEILCLPNNLLLSFFEGYLDSDGCYIEKTDTYSFSSVNANIIYSMALIINKVFHRPTKVYYIKTPDTTIIENRVVHQQDWYQLKFIKNKTKYQHAFYDNGYIWYPYNGYENGQKEHVYNMEIDVDHSYIVQGCISKNCQDFSIAGLQKGGDEGSGTRSSLMYETIRLVKKLNPKYVVWENVKNLVSDKHEHNFNKYLKIMEELGFNNYYKVLNAKNYGIPQNRERVFTVSIRKDIDEGTFYFPKEQKLILRLKDLLEESVDEKYYLSDDKIESISQWKAYQKPLENVLGNNSISPTLTARGAGEEHAGMITYSDEFDDTTNVQSKLENMSKSNRVIQENITQKVKVRKYNVDTIKLSELLKESKKNNNLNNKEIASKLNIPLTQVEHYFRTDDSFAIPGPEIWLELKEILGIETDEFDKNIMTFEEKDNTYDMSNRAYHIEGIAPTLDTNSDKKIIEYKGKEVELPAMCASRGRNLENPSDRSVGQKLEQTIEINTNGVSNTLTTFQKDNYVIEPQVLKRERTEFGKTVRKQYESGETDLKRDDVLQYVPRNDGISNTITTVTKDNYVVEGTVDVEKDIDNPLKGISGQSWQFEQNVYSEDSKCIRTIKAGEGSGNIPKIIENNYDDTKINVVGNYKPSGHSSGRILNANGIAPTVMENHGSITAIVENISDKNKKEQLCDYMINNDMVEPYDVINHGYTEHRFSSIQQNKDIVMSKNMAPTITTRPDELGVAVHNNSEKIESQDAKTTQQPNTQNDMTHSYSLRIRKLTPKECWRLMGFDDEDFDKAAKVCSNAQLYKQAGNSIVVNVLEAILNSMFRPDKSLPKRAHLQRLF